MLDPFSAPRPHNRIGRDFTYIIVGLKTFVITLVVGKDLSDDVSVQTVAFLRNLKGRVAEIGLLEGEQTKVLLNEIVINSDKNIIQDLVNFKIPKGRNQNQLVIVIYDKA
jgi:hypothetical protein